MKTTQTYTEQNTNSGFMKHVAVAFSILFACLIIQPTVAQNGKLKLRGDIVNVADEQTKSLITLFRVPEDSDQKFVLGQYVVTGNDWFQAQLQLDKEYLVEIASTNGLIKRFVFNTRVPANLENSRLKLDLYFNMGATDTAWKVVDGGKVSFDDQNDAFAFTKKSE